MLGQLDSWELTAQMRSEMGGAFGPSMLIPWHRLTRDLTASPFPPWPWPTSPGSDGGNLMVPSLEVSQHLLGSSAAVQVGCRLLPNLRGNVGLTRISSSVVTSWLGETDPVPGSDQVFSQLALIPRRISAMVIYSSQLLQTSSNLDQLLVSDFRQQLSQQTDYAVLLGAGGTEPLGLWSNDDVIKPPVGNGDVWSWDWVTEAERQADNFVASGLSFGVIGSPGLKKIWQDLSKYAPGGGGGVTVWESIPLKSYTPVLSGDAAAAGPWQLVTIGVFGPGVETIVDRYTLANSARIRLVCNAWVDVACRLPEAFTMTRRGITPPPLQQRRAAEFPPPAPPAQPPIPEPESVSAQGEPQTRTNPGGLGPKPGRMKTSHLFK